MSEVVAKETRGSTRQVHIPRALLQKFYVEEEKSTGDIARILGCSQDTVIRRMEEYSIPRRKRSKDISKRDLYRLYFVEGKSIKYIAHQYDCSHTTIGNRIHSLRASLFTWKDELIDKREEQKSKKNGAYIKEHVVDIIRAYKSGNSASFIAKAMGLSRWQVLDCLRREGVLIRQSFKKKQLNMQELRYLYVEQKMSTVTLGEIYKVKPCTITSRLREMGIPLRGNKLALNTTKIINDYEQGQSVLKIAEQMGCSYTAIKKRLETNGVYRHRGCLETEEDEIIALYRGGQTLIDIASRFNCCENTILNILKRHHIARRSRGRKKSTTY